MLDKKSQKYRTTYSEMDEDMKIAFKIENSETGEVTCYPENGGPGFTIKMPNKRGTKITKLKRNKSQKPDHKFEVIDLTKLTNTPSTI